MNGTPETAKARNGKLYPWTRYWVSLGAAVNCGWKGDWFFEPNGSGAIATDDLLERSPLLILLGGPGMGKSIELRALLERAKANSPTLDFRATALGPDPRATICGTREWRDHETSGNELCLFVDGIDEALPHHPLLLDQLVDFSRRNVAPTLRIVLCLRSGSWNGSRYSDLFEAWNVDGAAATLEICPIRKSDVELAFRLEVGEEPSSFTEWLWEKGLGPLARTPIHTRGIIAFWREDPNREVSAHELRGRQISILLQDDSEGSRLPRTSGALSASKAEALAEMVAVHALLSGRLSLGFSSTDGAETLNLTSFIDSPLDGRWRQGSSPIGFDEQDLRELMDRALFTRISPSGDPPRFAFAHHTFAEHLASQSLDRQPFRQLLRLLGGESAGRIPPQMAGPAAMLAVSNELLREWLLDHEPALLLRGDGLRYPEDQRARIVGRVLDSIEEADDNRRLEAGQIDSGFACPEVSEVLASRFLDRNPCELTRCAALTIALRCPEELLGEKLWTLITDAEEQAFLRSRAISAWLRFAAPLLGETREKIWQIARGEAGVGRAHDRADALLVLLDQGEPVRRLLEHAPPKDENLIGSLELLLDHHIPRRITPDDLPACLAFLAKNGAGRLRGIRDRGIDETTYRLTLENLDRPELLKAFADHWWCMARDYYLHLEHELRAELQALPDTTLRSLTKALVESDKVPNEVFVWHLPPGELPLEWALSQLSGTPECRRERWLKIIGHLWIPATKSGIPTVLAEAYQTLGQDFRDVFPRPTKGRSFEETVMRHHRLIALLRERRERHYESLRSRRLGHLQPTRAELTEMIERELPTEPQSAWVRFSMWAFESLEGDEEDSEERFQTLKSAGWRAFSEDGHRLLRSAAREFLITREASYTPGEWSNWLEAAYLAIDLLLAEVETDSDLRRIVGERWIDAVLHHFNNAEERHQALVKLIAGIAPIRARRWLFGQVAASLDAGSWPLDLRAFAASWDKQYSNELVDLIYDRLSRSWKWLPIRRISRDFRKSEKRRRNLGRNVREEPKGIVMGFHFLADVDSDAARRLLLLLAYGRPHPRREPYALLPLLLLHGLLRFPETWGPVWDALHRQSPGLLRRAFRMLAPDLDREYFPDGSVKRLSDQQAFQLFSRYCDLFPNPSVYRREGSLMTPRDHLENFEQSVRQHLSDAGASSAITRLICQCRCPRRRDALRWYLNEARNNAARNRWQPLHIAEVSGLLQKKDAVLVRNASDLKCAILTSLARYQDHLRQDGQALLDCWEQQAGKPAYRPIHEENLSTRIAKHLSNDLGSVIVAREQEIRLGVRKGRTDVTVSAVINGEPFTVIIEHKRGQNPHLETTIHKQLVERYLRPSDCSTGILLVSWFDGFHADDCRTTNSIGAANLDGLDEHLSAQASEAMQEGGFDIDVHILDCVPQSATHED